MWHEALHESVLLLLSILMPHFLDIKSETCIYTLADLNSHDMEMSPYISLPVLRGCVHVCASVMDKSLSFSTFRSTHTVCKLCLTVTQKTDALKPEMDYTGSSLSLSLHSAMFLDVDMPGMILSWPQSDPHLVPQLASACVRNRRLSFWLRPENVSVLMQE